MSVFHWMVLVVPIVLFFVPVAMILKKAGFSPWLVLVTLVPVVNLVGLWLFAFVTWPVNRAPK